jgi:predicted dienelactone hydrolase
VTRRAAPVILMAVILMALILTNAVAAAAQAGSDTTSFKVGVTTRRFVPDAPYNWRGAQTRALIATVWYPASPEAVEQAQWVGPPGAAVFNAGSAAPDAALAPGDGRFPLVVLSHGTGGTALSLGWLGTALAAKGSIAVAVNHPGNNALEAYTVEGFSLWWERARDVSSIIDHMLAEPNFGGRIDAGRIGAAGFSLGGYTVIELAGGITDPARFHASCRSPDSDGACKAPPEFPDLGAKLDALAKIDPAFQASLRDAGKSYRDKRIRAVFAMAPALGPAVTPESLGGIAIPVEIVAGSEDAIVPVASSAQYFAANIPGAKLTLFSYGVGHYTFLSSCSEQGRTTLPALCQDATGVDRDEIHALTINLAVAFFARTLR